MSSAWLLPEHIADVLPARARHIEALRRGLLDAAAGFGFELVIPPMLEHIESLLSGTGHALDLQTFKLVDQLSGRTLGIRADSTPQVARIDAHLLNRKGVARLCYCGPVLHTRASGSGTTREPLQFGAEIYGHAGLEADLEILDLALQCLAVAGLASVVLDLADARIVRAVLAGVPVDVARLLHLQSGHACAHTQPDGIAAILSAGARFVSVDANCDLDLDRIAAAILPMGRRILWVGSAGLASALARLLGQACAPRSAPARTGAALFCIGSDHSVTGAQQSSLLAQRPSVLLHPHAATRESVCQALAGGKHVILRIPRGLVSVERVRECIAGVPAAALVLSGGDTASLVCRAAGVQRIELCDEIVSGVPHGILHGGEFDGVSVATKSGGFGRSDTLIQVADYFSCLNRT